MIDLYQIHWPEPETEIEEGWSEIARLVEAGKIRYAGVSNFSVAQIRRMQAIHPVASLQPPYNLLDRNVERELLPFYAANGIGVVAYSPMASGLLTGKYTRESIASLPADDWRQQSADFQEPAVGPSLDLVEKLRPLARRHNGSVGQLAAAWVLRRAEVTAAIVGVRSPAQITEAAQAADWVLTPEELAEIEALLKARDAALAHAAGNLPDRITPTEVNTAMSKAQHPNVVLICTDEQRYASLGCLGNPYAVTPNLDGLAREATVFKQHIVANPVCMPSRVL